MMGRGRESLFIHDFEGIYDEKYEWLRVQSSY
jgi:hypothetical protein